MLYALLGMFGRRLVCVLLFWTRNMPSVDFYFTLWSIIDLEG